MFSALMGEEGEAADVRIVLQSLQVSLWVCADGVEVCGFCRIVCDIDEKVGAAEAGDCVSRTHVTHTHAKHTRHTHMSHTHMSNTHVTHTHVTRAQQGDHTHTQEAVHHTHILCRYIAHTQKVGAAEAGGNVSHTCHAHTCHTHTCVTYTHVTHTHSTQTCHTHRRPRVTLRIQMSHVRYERVMSRTNESCHI